MSRASEPRILWEAGRTLPAGYLVEIEPVSIDRSPGYKLLAEALGRHLGDGIAELTRSPFSLADGEELRGLLTGAGFGDVHIRLALGDVRSPSAADLLWQVAAASSSWLAGPASALTDDARGALTDDFTAAMRPYTNDDGIVFPTEAHVAVARR